MVIAVRAAMSHYAPHLLFIVYPLCVVLCALPPLARFLVSSFVSPASDAGLSYVHSSALYAASPFLRDSIPLY